MVDLAPGDRVDRYVVETRLGEGGMAVVYRVRHADLGTLHALKVLVVRAPGLSERTLQEGRIQATIRHENLVAVTDVLRVDGAPALVLEYVDGPTLQTLITQHPPSPAQVDDLAGGILRGVAFAHRSGLVHRDLKPANVLIATSGGRIVPKVADFGMAKVLDDALRRDGNETRTGIGLGTPTWMAPEQFRDAKGVDARADVFALGAILYALVTGTPPFTGNDLVAILDAKRSRSWRPVRDWSPSVPARWERAIAAAMEPDPADRPADVEALAALWRGDADDAPARPLAVGDAWEPEQIARIRELPGEATPPRALATVAPTVEPDAVVTPAARVAAGPTIEPPPSPSGRAVLGAVLLRGAALSLSLLLAAAIGYIVQSGTEAPQAGPPPTVEVDVTAPAVATPTTPEGLPEPAPVVASAPRPRPVPAVVPARAPEPVPITAREPAPTRASLTVVGADRALLVTPSGARMAPGEVPPGRYTLWVYFDATDPTEALDLDLAAGDRRTVTCEAAMRTCR